MLLWSRIGAECWKFCEICGRIYVRCFVYTGDHGDGNGGNRERLQVTQVATKSWLLLPHRQVASSMTHITSNNRNPTCTRGCTFVPLLLLLTITVLVAKLAQTHHYRPHNVNTVELSSNLFNVSKLALTSGCPYANPWKVTCGNDKQCTLSLLVIVLSGDIELNPSPIKYPCITCQRPVASNQRALGCESCDSWVHIKCCGVTPSQYKAYLRGGSIDTWTCPICVPEDAAADINSSSSDSSNLSMHSESDTTTNTGTKPQTRADRIKITIINVNSIQSKGKAGAFKHLSKQTTLTLWLLLKLVLLLIS